MCVIFPVFPSDPQQDTASYNCKYSSFPKKSGCQGHPVYLCQKPFKQTATIALGWLLPPTVQREKARGSSQHSCCHPPLPWQKQPRSPLTFQSSSSLLHLPFTLEAALGTLFPTLRRRSAPALHCHEQLAHFWIIPLPQRATERHHSCLLHSSKCFSLEDLI